MVSAARRREPRDESGLRRPWLALVVAAIALVVLGVLGLGVEDRLEPSSIEVPGTPSASGSALLEEHFGDSEPFVILLRGPAAAIDEQGPELVRALRREGDVVTLSPWDRGSPDALRPSLRKAMILADFRVDAAEAVQDVVPALNRTLEETIRPPVTAKQTGFATLSRAIQDESVDATRAAELIAIPFLLLVLLFVFRSPVAAIIPLAFGAAAVIATRGILALLAPSISIDGFALTVATMMGLALGVDYALLMVSRFREELAAGSEPRLAALRTRRTAGRTTAFAGSTVLLAMAVTVWLMPGSLFLSLAGTAILVTVVSVAIATLVGPPLLCLLGPRIDRWQLGPAGNGRHLMTFVDGALRRPRLAAATIGGILVLLAIPALGIETGPPSVSQLPTSNQARQDAETIDRAIGAGWDAPFFFVAATTEGPITAPGRLDRVRSAQRRIADDPGVQAVIGPAQIERRVEPLRRNGNELLAGEGDLSPDRLSRLGNRLDRAAGGVGQIRGGLADAASGAGLLATGSGRASEGADQISSGLARAASGATGAVEALGKLDDGSAQLAAGQRQAALGARALRDELSGLLPVIRQGGLAKARKLRAQLGAAAAADPALEDELREASSLVEALALARNQGKRARATASRLHSGQVRLAEGGARLHRGAARLNQAAAPLPGGLDRLGTATGELARGLERLTGGADALNNNLAAGSAQTQPLQRGLDRAGTRVSVSASRLSRQVGSLRRSSPGIFDSGYFVLSALEGAPADERERAGQVVDLEHGGQAIRTLVVPRAALSSPGSKALNLRLRAQAAELASASGFETGVTGGPAQLADYTDAISSRVPLVIAVITLATFLVLVLVLRALPLAAIAVALNLLTVGVAFGILTLLFDVPTGWPLGGHTYVDAIGAAGIFGIVFGLSIDYAVFLLTRMRERHDAGASNREAVAYGLQRTARVITGAAAIMVAVFVVFAAAPIATVSQLGTGLTVAVILDATVVRIVLLPALMLVVGERVWWLPRGLEKVLPRIGIHAT